MATAFLSHIAMSPAPTKTCGPNRIGGAGVVGVWLGVGPVGDWLPQWDDAAKRAAEGRYLDNGVVSERQQRGGLKPETRFRPDDQRKEQP